MDGVGMDIEPKGYLMGSEIVGELQNDPLRLWVQWSDHVEVVGVSKKGRINISAVNRK
jgi:hypothetical protein